MVNIYERAFKEMKLDEIDHHYSDLYLKVTPVSKRLVSEYEFKNQVETFRSINPKDAEVFGMISHLRFLGKFLKARMLIQRFGSLVITIKKENMFITMEL